MRSIIQAVSRSSRWVAVAVSSLLGLFPAAAFAAEPGRGATAKVEVAYLQFIIDHHFGALRMTELAAGTDAQRDAALAEREGTSQTPGFEPSVARAELPEIFAMARRDNRAQREEILKAQKFLREWYGITHEPVLTAEARASIEQLQQVSGAAFDEMFLRMFSTHHLAAATQSLNCVAGRDPAHSELRRYCSEIVMMQMNEIDEMKEMLCEKFSQCDVVAAQPSSTLKKQLPWAQ